MLLSPDRRDRELDGRRDVMAMALSGREGGAAWL